MIPAFVLKFIPGGPQLAMGVVLVVVVVALLAVYLWSQFRQDADPRGEK